MNVRKLTALSFILAVGHTVQADDYTNMIRQVQNPGLASEFEWDVTGVAQTDQNVLSPLAIDPGGARFELWTIKNSPTVSYLLDSKYVGAFIPSATVNIRTEDPYTVIPRTRADRPFYVDIDVTGLRTEADAPDEAKHVRFLHHIQSYGAGGTGTNVNRSAAILYTQSDLRDNGSRSLTFALPAVPGADRSKLRGEERFSVFSADAYQSPSSQLASKFVQIWPVADGSISGLDDDEQLRFNTPSITFTMNDLYPDSRTYAQIYPGSPVLGTEGTTIPGTALIIYDTVPHSRTLVVDDWDEILEDSGEYTIELLTSTPFGVDRLDYVTFSIDRDIQVNGSVTTIE